MSVRKTGRKHRALERIRANQNFVDGAFQRRRDLEQESSCARETKRSAVAEFVIEHPDISTRKLERRFRMHRETITSVREEIGFVVPKKDYRCYTPRYEGQWPKQPGETPGICACGCGGKTTKALHNKSGSEIRAGQFYRFVSGHQWLLRRRLCKPRGWKSSHDYNLEREKLRRELVIEASKLPRYTKDKVATFEDLRGRLKKIELNGHNVVDQQVSRMINVGRWVIDLPRNIPRFVHANTATKAEWLERLVSVSVSLGKEKVEFTELCARFAEPMLVSNGAVSRLLNRQRELSDERIPTLIFKAVRPKPVAPITECYPFGAQDDLLQFILSILPERYSQDVKADMAQDMALAVVSGECSRDELPNKLHHFIRNYWKRFSHGQGHLVVSMDAPISEGGTTLHEVLSLQDSMTELNGGKNWETASQYFERSEQGFGEICARY